MSRLLVMWRGLWLTSAGPWRLVAVQSFWARPTSSRNTPRVATSFSEVPAPRFPSGRNTRRSRSRPIAGPTTKIVRGAAMARLTFHWELSCQRM